MRFNVDELCAIAASADGEHSPIQAIEKIEGSYCKALLMRKENGSEVVAKIPYSNALYDDSGTPRFMTESEVTVFKYCISPLCTGRWVNMTDEPPVHMHTQVPVPKVLVWDADHSTDVGAEYIIMERASGVQLNKVWDRMSDLERFDLVDDLTEY